MTWDDIVADIVYRIGEYEVAFSQSVLRRMRRYDPQTKHLKAIEKGSVGPKGQTGLVPSEEPGYDLKTKVLGKGGALRVYGYFREDDVLYFDQVGRH